MTSFSARLIALRKERDMTQYDLAKATERTRSTISGYETEGKEPNYETLCEFANFFGVTTDYLLGVSDSRSHAGAVFLADSGNFKELFDGMPASLRNVVAQTYDDFYVLLNRDMRQRRSERLELYRKLMQELQVRRNDIKRKIEKGGGALAEPAYMSELMALQSSLKNNISVLLDALMQADMEVAHSLKKGPKNAQSKKAT